MGVPPPAAISTGLLVLGLASCAGTGPITVHLELSTTHAVAGQPIKGTLVVTNPGDPVNLTQVVPMPVYHTTHPSFPRPRYCRPEFGVVLVSATYRQQFNIHFECSPKLLVIVHGTTRLSFTVDTTYTECAETGGTVTPTSPPCGLFGAPPLPTGVYKAVIVWSERVPLPKAPPVVVTLTGSSS